MATRARSRGGLPVGRLIVVGLLLAAVAVSTLLLLNRARQGLERQIAQAEGIMNTEAQRAPFRSLEWHDASDRKTALEHRRSRLWHELLPDGDSTDADLSGTALELRGRAEVAQAAAAETGFQDPDLNREAARAIVEYRAALKP